MSSPGIALSSVSVVLKGQFSPAIFSPSWFLAQDLIGVQEHTASKVNIITPDLASFIMGWLNLDARLDMLQLATSDESEFDRVRDAAVGTLKILPHSPLTALGINQEFHFPCNDSREWHAIGDKLAPKNFWEGVVDLPGMRSVSILGVRSHEYTGRVQITVEPSMTVQHGIFVSINDHYDLRNSTAPIRSREEAEEAFQTDIKDPYPPSEERVPLALKILTEEWLESLNKGTQILSRIADIVKGIDDV